MNEDLLIPNQSANTCSVLFATKFFKNQSEFVVVIHFVMYVLRNGLYTSKPAPYARRSFIEELRKKI